MTTQVDFKVRSSQGESEFKILHHVSRFPFAYLQRANSTTYEGSWTGSNWLPFSSHDTRLDRSNAMICKAQDHDRKTAHKFLVKHVGGDIFATCKLESSVKMKELQALPTTMPVWSSLENCSVVPEWTQQSMADLSLEPPTIEPSLITPEQTPTAQAPLPPEPNLDDPVMLLQYKYYDLLYANQTLPLVHFAKSTLAKLRSLYRSRHRDDKAAYRAALWECLRTVALTTNHLDMRYNVSKVTEFLNEESPHPFSTCDLERQYQRFWSSNLHHHDLRRAIEQAKVRELQLQVILLLEMLVVQPASEKKTAKPEQKPAYAAISLVRRKKKPKKKALSLPEENEEFDPDSLVDLAFDRLCIWQAFSSSLTPASKKEKGPDIPYDLCKHVLIPYYGKSLPAKTKLLAKKATGSINKLSKAKRQSNDKNTASSAVLTNTAVTVSLRDELPAKDIQPTALEAVKKSLLMSKRQVELNKSLKPRKQQQHATAEEIADAVRNISKPNRMEISSELASSKPFIAKRPARKAATTTSKKKEVIQVAASDNLVTPSMNRKRFKTIEFSTPVKKFKLSGIGEEAGSDDEEVIGSSPLKTPLKQRIDVIACTPLKAGNNSDTDEDMI